MVIIPDCLSGDGSSILPRVAKLCSNGMEQTPGNERPILVARRGSSPLTAPSFVSVDDVKAEPRKHCEESRSDTTLFSK